MIDYSELVKALRRCAEPGTIIDECDTFDDCPYSLDGYCGDCMNNLVKDAAAAIEALNRLVDLNTERCEGLREQLRKAQEQYEKHINELEKELLAKQLQKRGKWEPIYFDNKPLLVECSNCGARRIGKVPYCPFCGSKMEDA